LALGVGVPGSLKGNQAPSSTGLRQERRSSNCAASAHSASRGFVQNIAVTTPTTIDEHHAGALGRGHHVHAVHARDEEGGEGERRHV
jgi:hypothetical protein